MIDHDEYPFGPDDAPNWDICQTCSELDFCRRLGFSVSEDIEECDMWSGGSVATLEVKR